MRLDVKDPNVFDKWRELYYDLTHEENIQFGNDMEALYPHQASFNPDAVISVLKEFKHPRVFEIGGWKGELALLCLKQQLASSWINIDMCKAAIDKTLPELKGWPYAPVFPSSFDWFAKDYVKPTADIVISCHTIEHLTDKHLAQLITYLTLYDAIYFEAPINEGESDWSGYKGTHILKMGWNGIDTLMSQHKYKTRKINNWARYYKRG